MADFKDQDELKAKRDEPMENNEIVEDTETEIQAGNSAELDFEAEADLDEDLREAEALLERRRAELMAAEKVLERKRALIAREREALADKNTEQEAGTAEQPKPELSHSIRTEESNRSERPVSTGRGRSRARKNAQRQQPAYEQDAGVLAGKTAEAASEKASGMPTGKAVETPAGKVSGSPAESSAASQLTEGKSGGGKKKAMIAGGVLAALLLILGGTYFALGQKYKKVYFPNTKINGVDASGKTIAEVRELIAAGIDGYVLTIEERGDKTEQISKEDINLHSVFDGSLEKILFAQNPSEWLKYQFSPSVYEIETMIAYDETALEEKVNSLDCMNPELMIKPENARISDYIENQGYTIVPEVPGTAVIPETVKNGISDAILNLKEKVSLEEIGAYEAPELTRDDERMTGLLETMNRYAAVTVTYQFGDKQEVLNGSRIREWLTVNSDNSVSVDSEQVAAFVSELAAAYNTSNKAKTLKTSYGPTITVSGGTYGWRINQSEEAAALEAIIVSGESQTREPVYAQKAASHGANDYGDTYVEINLTAQHLFYYKDGVKVVESDFVSGSLSKGWGTPAGTYPLTYKQRDATLKGENYRTPVDYWMPFNGGIGMHDATWRGTFGGTIYKTSGSHGCINLPHSVAKKIFENIQAGTPVICYNLAGTEQSGSSAQTPETVPPTEAVPEVPAENQDGQSENSGQPITPEQPTQAPEPGQSAGGEPAGEQPVPEQPIQVPETTAPAGPGADTGNSGSAQGPGAA